MQPPELDFVALIENNPIINLSNNYNNKLLNKIKETFSTYEQQLFVSSFYCYLNYNKHTDFVINLDNVWKWMGFTLKENAKRVLLKHFTDEIDYTYNTETPIIKERGGQNKQTIMMTIKCFKSMCLKAQTSKANEIHDYYIKLEEIIQDVLIEESTELKHQLLQKDKCIVSKDREIEQALVSQFPLNTECIYIGTICNTNDDNECLLKFGHTNNLSNRIYEHHTTYDNFALKHAFKVQNKVEIENMIKVHPKIKKQLRTISINGKNKMEIIAYSEAFTIDRLVKYINDIIQTKIYSVENFEKLTARNAELEIAHNEFIERIHILEKENLDKTLEINELKSKLESYQKVIEVVAASEESVYQNVLLPDDELNAKFAEFVKQCCFVRPDVEEVSVNLEGRFRLWTQTKPTKENFHALKNYMDIRFKPKRVGKQHGYVGLRLNPVEYKKQHTDLDAETFVFSSCQFADTAKIFNSTLLIEYRKWKMAVGKPTGENDAKELKEYLNASPYVMKATVWISDGANDGYYGICMKQGFIEPKIATTTTGKTVYKREVETHRLINTWDSIIAASIAENVCAAKMSRYVKNKTVVNDYYFSNS